MYLIGMIIYSSIKVFKPDNKNILTSDQVLQEQLEIMLALISYALTLLMDTWLFFTLYIEYCYLKGYRKNKSQENV
uniref:Uncharacterized protein n=1 Tax=Acrobeloides nanus TaxID=290746 RepID=A0A914E2K9_9BILA